MVCLTPRRHETCACAVLYNHMQDWSPEVAPVALKSGEILLSTSGWARSGTWRLQVQFLEQLNWSPGSLLLKEWKGLSTDHFHLDWWYESGHGWTHETAEWVEESGWDDTAGHNTSQKKCVNWKTFREDFMKFGKTGEQLHSSQPKPRMLKKRKKKKKNNNKAGQYSSKIPFSSARPENWVAVGQTGPACWSSKSASSWPTPSTGHSTSTVPTRRVQTPSQQQRRAWWHLVHPEHNSQLPQISCEPLSWMQGSKGQGRNYFWFDLPTTWLYEFVTIWLFKASVSLRACFVLIWQ